MFDKKPKVSRRNNNTNGNGQTVVDFLKQQVKTDVGDDELTKEFYVQLLQKYGLVQARLSQTEFNLVNRGQEPSQAAPRTYPTAKPIVPRIPGAGYKGKPENRRGYKPLPVVRTPQERRAFND